MPNVPKPLSRLKVAKALESFENESKKVRLTDYFEDHVESVWDLSNISPKEMLELHESLKKSRRNSVVLVKLS
jgi:hypothetical protein